MWKLFVLAASISFVGCTSAGLKTIDERALATTNSVTSPRLFIQPAPIFDMVCKQKTGFKLDPAMESKYFEELNKKVNLFQAEWDKRAGSINSESERAAGRTFSRKEYSVALTLCDWVPMGDPAFIVSAFPYLGPPRKFNGFDMPLNRLGFVSMTHHELLHSLVDNLVSFEFSRTSNLLEKYKTEPWNVLIHLHLMAIQKATYQRLKEPELLKATDQLYAFIGGDYQRAWQIVAFEGVDKFLAELQSFNSKYK